MDDNQQTDEMREERRNTKPAFNGCVRYKRREYCQPCVAMASNYTYAGEDDRREVFHQYSDEASQLASYEAALREAKEALKMMQGYMLPLGSAKLRDEALAAIDKLLGGR